MGDRVTVDEAVEAAVRVAAVYPTNAQAHTVARFVLQEHSGDREEGGCTCEPWTAGGSPLACDRCKAEWAAGIPIPEGWEAVGWQQPGPEDDWLGADGLAYTRSIGDATPDGPRLVIRRTEPPRPELPPEREGWVLTGEFREPRDGEWSAHSASGEPVETRGGALPHKGGGKYAVVGCRARYILLKVPAPPDDGWVVTKYEEPPEGARYLGAAGRWCRKMNALPFPANGPYPDGKRFIAEQEDRDDDRTRLAKALLSNATPWDRCTKEYWLPKADRLLALGVKAPDPVRLESL